MMTPPVKAVNKARSLTWIAALIGVALFVLLSRYCDFAGYEGDDLNSIVPMTHLAAAKAGALLIYRYHWQPLSYELGAYLYQLTGTTRTVFLTSPLGAAATIALLAIYCVKIRGLRRDLAYALLIMSWAPELIFSGLYYNSTMPAMPLLALAMLLLRFGKGDLAPVLAGIAFGLAILMRLDFMMVGPALAMLAYARRGKLRPAALLTIATLLCLTGGWLLGIIDPVKTLQEYQVAAKELHDRAHEPGWDLRAKLWAASVLLSPVGWVMTGLLGSIGLVLSLRAWPVRCLLWILAALPMLLLVSAPLSPKYELPIIPFLVVFQFWTLIALEGRLERRSFRRALAVIVAISLLQYLVSVSLYGHSPFVRLGGRADRLVATADGDRSYGGYVWLATDMVPIPTKENIRARSLESQWLDAGLNIAVIGDENYFSNGGFAWRNLAVRLSNAGVRSRVVAPHVLIFDVDGTFLLLMTRANPALVRDIARGQPVHVINLAAEKPNGR